MKHAEPSTPATHTTSARRAGPGMASAVALALSSVLSFAVSATPAMAQSGPINIGLIDDMSGLYSDLSGAGAAHAARMAIEDFGGKVLDRKVELLTADHQNKPDIGSSKFREWADTNQLAMLLAGANTGVSIAMSKMATQKKVPMFGLGAAGSSLTNADCSPYVVHYVYNTTALANGTASTMVKEGAKTWYFLTADYAFGTQLQEAATKVVTKNGGKSVGAVRVPLNTTDLSSFLLQAQGSGAQVLGMANAGSDFINSMKSAREFGITTQMKPAALLAFLSDIHSLGLDAAQGLNLTTAWYWDMNDESREFSKRYFEKMKKQPTMVQSGTYSATLTWLKAVKAAGTTDSDKVMAELKKMTIDDMFVKGGKVRDDGLMEHPMYVMKVKSPKESKKPWDYYELVKKLDGEAAFGPLSESTCPLLKK